MKRGKKYLKKLKKEGTEVFIGYSDDRAFKCITLKTKRKEKAVHKSSLFKVFVRRAELSSLRINPKMLLR